jgi:hypothetical protein
MDETLNITRRRGFKVALTIQPFFSTQSPNYEEGLHVGGKDGGIWLAEKHPGKTYELGNYTYACDLIKKIVLVAFLYLLKEKIKFQHSHNSRIGQVLLF